MNDEGPIPDDPQARPPWYHGVSRYAWLVLVLASLGWLFDTMDQNIFNLVRLPSLHDLLRTSVPPVDLKAATSSASGVMTSVFLMGWAAGGFLFGSLGDRIGRVRTMALTILVYASFTGLTGLTHSLFGYGVCRFLTALGVGGEFAAGASLVAEVFPARSRAMALGALQAFSAVGNMMAAGITYFLSGFAESWRWAYAVGALPALLVFALMRVIQEPHAWQRATDLARSRDQAVGSITALFADPNTRRSTIAGTLMALAGVGGLWGVGFWLPELTNYALAAYHFTAPDMTRVKSEVFLVQQVGALLGMFAYAGLSERIGRRPALALSFLLALGAVEGTFHWVNSLQSAFGWALVMGFCALAPFSAYSVYFPELFPTRLRATGVGFCYNCARIFAAGAPYLLGKLTAYFEKPGEPAAGLRTAAGIVACIYLVGFVGIAMAPETQGRALPE